MEHGIGTAAQTTGLTESQQWIEVPHDRVGGGETNPVSSRGGRFADVECLARSKASAPATNRLPHTVLPINVTDADSSRQHGQTANRRRH